MPTARKSTTPETVAILSMRLDLNAEQRGPDNILFGALILCATIVIQGGGEIRGPGQYGRIMF